MPSEEARRPRKRPQSDGQSKPRKRRPSDDERRPRKHPQGDGERKPRKRPPSDEERRPRKKKRPSTEQRKPKKRVDGEKKKKTSVDKKHGVYIRFPKTWLGKEGDAENLEKFISGLRKVTKKKIRMKRLSQLELFVDIHSFLALQATLEMARPILKMCEADLGQRGDVSRSKPTEVGDKDYRAMLRSINSIPLSEEAKARRVGNN